MTDAGRPHTPVPTGPLPALYLGHGAPPLLEDETWMGEFRAWGDKLPRPSSILIVSAHWQTAPMAISATRPVPLVYDFYGFPEEYYRLRYDAPVAPDLAAWASRLPDLRITPDIAALGRELGVRPGEVAAQGHGRHRDSTFRLGIAW